MSITSKSAFFVALVLCLTVAPPLSRAEEGQQMQCHMLPIEHCAFAVDSDGNRCFLESIIRDNVNAYMCQKSDIRVGEDSPWEYVETEQCIAACGAERMTVGFSTDLFLTPGFASKLCSSECREGCPNLVDLYSNIVAGEGTTLPELCTEHRRSMLMSQYQQLMAAAPVLAPVYQPPTILN